MLDNRGAAAVELIMNDRCMMSFPRGNVSCHGNVSLSLRSRRVIFRDVTQREGERRTEERTETVLASP